MNGQIVQVAPSNYRQLLDRFHGFHDAEYGRISLTPVPGATSLLDCSILLLAFDFEASAPADVEFRLERVEELRINYNASVDYPNIRDDVSLSFHDGKLFVNLGFASEATQSPEDVLSSDVYFVCQSAVVRITPVASGC